MDAGVVRGKRKRIFSDLRNGKNQTLLLKSEVARHVLVLFRNRESYVPLHRGEQTSITATNVPGTIDRYFVMIWHKYNSSSTWTLRFSLFAGSSNSTRQQNKRFQRNGGGCCWECSISTMRMLNLKNNTWYSISTRMLNLKAQGYKLPLHQTRTTEKQYQVPGT